MKKNFRFYLTIFLTRILIVAMKLIGKTATHFPGEFALKLCPNFLSQISKPEKIVCITGTNGKTTTTNMIADAFMELNVDIVYNKLGANMQEGIISSLLQFGTSFWGNSTKKVGVFEADERMSADIYKHLIPDYLVVVNLSRDTIRREGNVEFVFDIVNNAIPKETTLVLNGDDIISTKLAPKNKRIYYSVAPLENEMEVRDSLVNDATYDIETGERYDYSFVRYHHFGRIKSHSPKPDYELTKYNRDTRDVEIISRGIKENYKLISNNETNLYNQLAAITIMKEFNFSEKEINKAFDNVKVLAARYEIEKVCDKELHIILAKGCSPVGASRVVEHIAKTDGNVAVILMNEEKFYAAYYSSWFFEIDYKLLNNDNIKQVITGGYYSKEMHLSILLQDVDENKVISEFDHVKTADLVDLDKADTIYLIHGFDSIVYKPAIKARLIERIKEHSKNSEEK